MCGYRSACPLPAQSTVRYSSSCLVLPCTNPVCEKSYPTSTPVNIQFILEIVHNSALVDRHFHCNHLDVKIMCKYVESVNFYLYLLSALFVKLF